MKVDLRDDIQVYDFKSSIVENFQKIDILINCAGIKLDGDVEKTFPQDFDYSIDINLRSIFLILRLFERYFNCLSLIFLIYFCAFFSSIFFNKFSIS